MSMIASEIRQTLLPEREGEYGPLPALMTALTFLTGLVDAFSYLLLGHVFVANMTGNVVFLAFALVGAPGFSVASSITAIVAFSAGSVAGGHAGRLYDVERGRHLALATAIQTVLFLAGVGLAAAGPVPLAGGYRYSLIVLLALAMGVQNATARKLAVPDLTTTVLTLTITGIASDNLLGGGRRGNTGRRLVAVGAMVAGACAGAAFILHGQIVGPLAIAAALAAGVAATAGLLSRSDPPWAIVRPKS